MLQVIDLKLPITVKLSIVDMDPGLKVDIAQGDREPYSCYTVA